MLKVLLLHVRLPLSVCLFWTLLSAAFYVGYRYGAESPSDQIPANSDLIFEVELLQAGLHIPLVCSCLDFSQFFVLLFMRTEPSLVP
jgi:hypothetical protein